MDSNQRQEDYISGTGDVSSAGATAGKGEGLKSTTSSEGVQTRPSTLAAFAVRAMQESGTPEKSTKESLLSRCSFSKRRNTSQLKRIGGFLKKILRNSLTKIKRRKS